MCRAACVPRVCVMYECANIAEYMTLALNIFSVIIYDEWLRVYVCASECLVLAHTLQLIQRLEQKRVPHKNGSNIQC